MAQTQKGVPFETPFRAERQDRGARPSDDLCRFGRAFLHRGHGPAGVVGVRLEAPETQWLGVEQIEDKPGQLIVVDEGNEGLPLDGVERVNVHLLKLIQCVAEAFVGPAGFLLGFLLGDDGLPTGPAGAVGEALGPMVVLEGVQSVFA